MSEKVKWLDSLGITLSEPGVRQLSAAPDRLGSSPGYQPTALTQQFDLGDYLRLAGEAPGASMSEKVKWLDSLGITLSKRGVRQLSAASDRLASSPAPPPARQRSPNGQYRAQQTQVYATAPRSYIPYSYTSTTMGAPAINTTTTTDSLGNLYTTNSQQMGNFTFSNTTGSNGYTANSTTTRLGTFDFINGSSSVGKFSGSSDRLGNFDFTNLTTPAGTWNGTSTQVGNFTFHNFVGPSGQTMSGTTTRIGVFIFTNIH
jgi:hypothetical protein